MLSSEYEQGKRVASKLMDGVAHLIDGGVMVCNMQQANQPIIFVNKTFEKITGYSAEDVLGRNARFLQKGECNQLELPHIRYVIQQRKRGSAILKNFTKQGNLFWCQLHLYPVPMTIKKSCQYYIGIIQDITQEIEHRNHADYYRDHDYMTGLFNYLGFYYQAKGVIRLAMRQGKFFSLGLVKVDFFQKKRNPMYELSIDVVIHHLAKVLGQLRSENDILAKLAGHQFVFAMAYDAVSHGGLEKKIAEIEKNTNVGLPDHLRFSLTYSFLLEKPGPLTSVEQLIAQASQTLAGG